MSFAILPGSNIVVGAVNFKGNPHDSQTLEATLNHCYKVTGKIYDNAIVDRGYKGQKQIGNTQIISPGSPKGKSDYLKRKMRNKCRSRAAIEPVIGYKSDCHMERNYLKGTVGDEINAIMAATALNFRRLLRKIEQDIILTFFRWQILPGYKLNPAQVQ